MVWLLDKDYSTNRCQFSIDTEADLELLPKYKVAGKGILNTISSCCPNSRAICTDGTIYVLNGDLNKWVKYTAGNCCGGSGGNSGSAGGGSAELPEDYIFATKQDINDLFGI